jgi:hypothetical protein
MRQQAVANIFKGRKERQRNSVNRMFVGDYMNFDYNYALKDVVQKAGRQEFTVFADQISIIELLKTQPVQISRKIVVSTFKNGGLGDNQSRGAFLEQMCKYNFQNGTNLQKLILILQLPIILIAKVILSILHRIRILFSR